MTCWIALPLLAAAQLNPYTCGGYGQVDDPNAAGAVPLCTTGQSQSPINISGSLSTPMDPSELGLEMFYPQTVSVKHAGDMWTIDASQDAYVMAKGQRFNLIQFHLHAPSEHTIDDKVYPAEIHFVHQAWTQQLLVIGMLFDTVADVNNSMLEELHQATAQDEDHVVQLNQRPYVNGIRNAGYFHYQGSLTAGSCAENLLWVVSKYVAPATDIQVCNLFNLAAGDDSRNIFETSRRAQELNGRIVKSSVFASSSSAAPAPAPGPSTTVEVAGSETSTTVEVKNEDDDEDKDDDAPVLAPAPAVAAQAELHGGYVAAIVVGAFVMVVAAASISAYVVFQLASSRMSRLAPESPSYVRSTPTTKAGSAGKLESVSVK